jgi:GH35 family endo-1,4-beta-xylanase
MAALAAPVFAAESAADPLAAEAVDARILKHRTAEVTLTITAPDGRPLADAAVTVEQVRHKFLFGCNAFGIKPHIDSDAQKAYQDRFAALLNYATLPFYWGTYERQEGSPGTDRVRAMAEWCKARGIRTKGHPLCWHRVEPRWLAGRPLEEVEKLQLGRITRDVTAFVPGDTKRKTDWKNRQDGWDSTPEGESRQGREVADFYRTLFSHPAVKAITWWDLSDLHAWLGAPAGLVRKDMSPKPAYEALMKLIKKEWWTGPLKLKTDAQGKVNFRGFLGVYSVRAERLAGTFDVATPGPAAVAAQLKPQQ